MLASKPVCQHGFAEFIADDTTSGRQVARPDIGRGKEKITESFFEWNDDRITWKWGPRSETSHEIGGKLRTITTSLPATKFCELLPSLDRINHRFIILRSLHQAFSKHIKSSH